ncbi:MAG TPA: hypothetical protein VE781_14975, partial [Kineosporiaceae bacterium]|nr:hypothetical protein [Kineosporiaceae bacterium]
CRILAGVRRAGGGHSGRVTEDSRRAPDPDDEAAVPPSGARAGDDAVRRAPADPADAPADPDEPLNPA